ncbi:hypothetical protein [Chengkuizengella axinellae]|uniref:Uncharacterized protein n=1 Tax=Chengkuizengella axinellae TaxID=3064388 RepID=A0ABT9J4N4_9BACL|nr:hypothetical protein [Chengkuizengella sp. 2205SS18-9]MDP5276549.1 hypothetical protein [Chengkuizengella sp. 2205SS18-9]
MIPIFFEQAVEPLIELPVDGDNRTLIALDIPKCYKHKMFKIDAFFELNFLVGAGLNNELNQSQNLPFVIGLNYQLFNGLGEICTELTPRLAETISGTVIFNQELETDPIIEFESNTTPNLTIIAGGLSFDTLNLVANITRIEGGVVLPFVNFRSMNVSVIN